MRELIAVLRAQGPGTHALAILVVVVSMLAVVSPVAGWLGGAMGIAAAAVAAAVCLVGALLGMAVVRLVAPLRNPVATALAPMVPRMGVPLSAAVAFEVTGSPLAEAGVLMYLIVFYPVTLTLETLLTLPSTGGSGPKP